MTSLSSQRAYQNSPFFEPRRQQRGIILGSGVSVILAALNHNNFLAGAVSTAMIVDLCLTLPFSLQLTATSTRALFEAAELKRGRLLKRAVVMIGISILFLSLSMHDLSQAKSGWKAFHLSFYFLGVMLCWLELHLAFATYYAKIFFRGNPLEPQDEATDNDEGPQELIFPGSDQPEFSDFLYISSTVALTFAMSDVSIESSRIRRTVMLQSLASFLFYSLIFSVVANLLISAS